MNSSRNSIRAALAALALLVAASGARAQCTGPNHIVWPAADPVWDFCVTRPSQSTPAPNGSGLEISSVKYRGYTVLRQAHIPILNVKYVPGGCGGGNLCYRDWFDSERAFVCAPVTSPGFCSGATTAASTVCNTPGADAGSFSGIAIEDFGNRLRITAQCQAGWYRYIPVWTFRTDGTIEASMEASAVNNGCVAYTHSHHGYFRMDFDVNGPGGDYLDVIDGAGNATRVVNERNFIDTSPARSHWRLGSAASPIVVDVWRTDRDGATGDVHVVPNDFPIADGWVLAYSASELSDDSTGLSDCPAGLNDFITGQSVDNADIVLWSRGGSTHQGEAGGIAVDCAGFGPTIKVTLSCATDSTPPAVTPPATLSTAAATCQGTAFGATSANNAALAAFLTAATATDICTPSPTALPPQVGGIDVTPTTLFPLGTTSVVFRFQDSTSNIGTATSSVIVTDASAPVVTAPAAIVVDQTGCEGELESATALTSPVLAAFLAAATGSDDCGASATALAPRARAVDVGPSTWFAVGTTPVTFRYQDASGNIGTATADVTVRLFWGDLDESGGRSATDLVLLANLLVGNVTPGVPPFTAPEGAADLDGSGDVTATDLVLLANRLVWNITCLPR